MKLYFVNMDKGDGDMAELLVSASCPEEAAKALKDHLVENEDVWAEEGENPFADCGMLTVFELPDPGSVAKVHDWVRVYDEIVSSTEDA